MLAAKLEGFKSQLASHCKAILTEPAVFQVEKNPLLQNQLTIFKIKEITPLPVCSIEITEEELKPIYAIVNRELKNGPIFLKYWIHKNFKDFQDRFDHSRFLTNLTAMY